MSNEIKAGGVRIRELTPEQLETKRNWIKGAEAMIQKAAAVDDLSRIPGYIEPIITADRGYGQGFSWYEVGNLVGTLPPVKAEIALKMFRDALPSERYKDAEEYTNNALIRKGESPVKIEPPVTRHATAVEPNVTSQPGTSNIGNRFDQGIQVDLPAPVSDTPNLGDEKAAPVQPEDLEVKKEGEQTLEQRKQEALDKTAELLSQLEQEMENVRHGKVTREDSLISTISNGVVDRLMTEDPEIRQALVKLMLETPKMVRERILWRLDIDSDDDRAQAFLNLYDHAMREKATDLVGVIKKQIWESGSNEAIITAAPEMMPQFLNGIPLEHEFVVQDANVRVEGDKAWMEGSIGKGSNKYNFSFSIENAPGGAQFSSPMRGAEGGEDNIRAAEQIYKLPGAIRNKLNEAVGSRWQVNRFYIRDGQLMFIFEKKSKEANPAPTQPESAVPPTNEEKEASDSTS